MPSSPPERNIVLIGFMGSGKSEVGRRLAALTGRRFIDTDELIEQEGRTVRDVFAAEGEEGFRRRERRAVAGAARARGAVIATGGGAVLDPRNVSALKERGTIVYLRATAADLTARLASANGRPLLGAARGPELRKRIEAILSERRPVYERVADHVVRSSGGPDATAAAIARRLRLGGAASPAPVKTTSVGVGVGVGAGYRVRVGRELLPRIAGLVRLPVGVENVGVVSHPRVRRLWGDALERGLRAKTTRTHWFTFPEGEAAKTPATAERLSRSLAKAGFHRSDVLLALGGGVVGDVTGFVASTYNRGIAYVQVPTTLLAMVDASIGGKTGVDLPEGKNLVGSFHHPLAVIADLDTLRTLPDRELRGGLAEVVKTAFIADPALGRYVVDHRDEVFARGACLQRIVARCARVKADVVAADEREAGRRMILNYGHTLGHALEARSLSRGAREGGRTLHHGEAIAIGMVFAAEVAKMGSGPDLVDEHRAILRAVGLPTRATGARWPQVKRYMLRDKKYKDGIRMVLLEAPGRPVVRRVSEPVLERAFEAVSATAKRSGAPD